MPCAWSGSLSQLKSLIRSEEYLAVISRNFHSVFQKPTDAEKASWKLSIPTLLDVLADPKFDQLQIILELAMPIGAERADVILLGGNLHIPRAIIIELKQWTGIQLDPQSNEVLVPGLGEHQHPSLQALNYSGKLNFFNSRAHNYQIKIISVFAQCVAPG